MPRDRGEPLVHTSGTQISVSGAVGSTEDKTCRCSRTDRRFSVEKPLAIQVASINVAPALSWVQGLAVSKAAIPSYLEIIDFIASGTTLQAVADTRHRNSTPYRRIDCTRQRGQPIRGGEVRTGSLHGLGAHPPGSEGAGPTDPRQRLMR